MKPGSVLLLKKYIHRINPHDRSVIKGGKIPVSDTKYEAIDIPAFVLTDYGNTTRVLYKHNDKIEFLVMQNSIPGHYKEQRPLSYLADKAQKALFLKNDIDHLYWSLRLINAILNQQK